LSTQGDKIGWKRGIFFRVFPLRGGSSLFRVRAEKRKSVLFIPKNAENTLFKGTKKELFKKSYPQIHGTKNGGVCSEKLFKKVCIFRAEMV